MDLQSLHLMSLAEAWRWVQIGFCIGVGGSVILGVVLGGLGAVFGGSPAAVHIPEDPHCSRCCPNEIDDDEGV